MCKGQIEIAERERDAVFRSTNAGFYRIFKSMNAVLISLRQIRDPGHEDLTSTRRSSGKHLSQTPLIAVFFFSPKPDFASLHCDCVSSIAISFSPFSKSRLCFCGQFDNQGNRTSLGRTSMKLTRRQKYNSSFLRKFNPLPCKEKLNLGTARLVLNHYMAISLFKNADQDPSGQKLIKTNKTSMR